MGLTDRDILNIAQIYAIVLLVGTCYFIERNRKARLPVILRPGLIISSTVAVASIASLSLDDDSYYQYFSLWVLQVFGIFAGLILSRLLLPRASSKFQITLNRERAHRLAFGVFVFGCISAGVFFLWQGVPLLQGNIEQSRVDAAAEGTGYLRLMAYLTIPSSLALAAIVGRRGLKYVFISICIILGLANRSPLVYVLIPGLFIYIATAKRVVRGGTILLVASILAATVVGLGTVRIFSQDEFAQYDEFRTDIREGDFLGVAWTSLTHYARVVSENAVLTKELVDQGKIEPKFGSSYLVLLITALPGEQLSLDREIKLASGKTFVGGGTPPTLMGEGYVNFYYLGTFMAGLLITFMLEFWFKRVLQVQGLPKQGAYALAYAVYGFFACWVLMSQVAGLSGASTFPLACAVVLAILWNVTTRKGLRNAVTT